MENSKTARREPLRRPCLRTGETAQGPADQHGLAKYRFRLSAQIRDQAEKGDLCMSKLRFGINSYESEVTHTRVLRSFLRNELASLAQRLRQRDDNTSDQTPSSGYAHEGLALAALPPCC